MDKKKDYSESMNKQSNLILLLLSFLLCLAIGGLFFIIANLPNLAERSFGTPSQKLDVFERIIISGKLILIENDIIQPAKVNGSAESFEIEKQESVKSISDRLERMGLIKNSEAMQLYLVYSGLDTTIQAGKFNISPSFNVMEIARELQDATPDEVEFIILPGWRLEEIAASLPTSGLQFQPALFIQLAQNPTTIELPDGIPPSTSLEGYFLPGKYIFQRETTVEGFTLSILKRFVSEIGSDLLNGFTSQGLNLSQAVTLASIIQREAVLLDEQPYIASVFYNRLAAGMKLDSDPTVQYAIGYIPEKKTWWLNPLTTEDLQFPSPYNTYNNIGLPPGPICNPGLPALKAVAFPEKTPYFYFRTSCDGSGSHHFSVTYEEHLQNACQ